MAVAVGNMNLSARGDVRRANNLIQICYMVKEISLTGCDDVCVVQRMRNKTSTKEPQHVGNNAMSLKLLFDVSDSILDSILGHVDDLGWQDCMWNEDNLANKKIFPGHQYSAMSKKWGQRIKATEQQMGILLYRMQTLHAAAPKFLRHKATGAIVEDHAERAACVIAVAAEARHAAPISEEMMRNLCSLGRTVMGRSTSKWRRH